MGMTFTNRALVLAAVATACFVARSDGASVTGVVVGTDYRSWTELNGATDLSISQGGGVVTLGLNLLPTTDLILSNSGARATLGTGTGDLSLTGLGSFSSALQVRLVHDRVLLKLTANAPSGKRELTATELQVVAAAGHPLLGFRQRPYGTGFDGGGSMTWGLVNASGYRLTVGAGGLVRGPFHLYQATSELHPASEWAATTWLEVGVSPQAVGAPLRLDLTYRGFGTDRLGSVDAFKEGAQLEAQARGLGDRETFHWDYLLRGVMKADNTTLGSGGSTVASSKGSSGNSAALLVGVDGDASPNFRLGVVAERDVVGRSDAFGRNGSVTGVGPRARLGLGSGTTLDLATQLWWGRVDGSDGLSHDARGLSVQCSLRWAALP